MRLFLGLSIETDAAVISQIMPSVLNQEAFQDAVLLSIDVEGIYCMTNEIGISILDIRDLKYPNTDPNSVVQSFNFRFQAGSEAEKPTEKMVPFRFCVSHRLQRRWLSWLLDKVLRTGSPDVTKTEERKTVLVGHSIVNDLQRLRYQYRCKWDWRFRFPSIPILDTQILEIG